MIRVYDEAGAQFQTFPAALLLIREGVSSLVKELSGALVNDYREIASGCVNLGSPPQNNSRPILHHARGVPVCGLICGKYGYDPEAALMIRSKAEPELPAHQ